MHYKNQCIIRTTPAAGQRGTACGGSRPLMPLCCRRSDSSRRGSSGAVHPPPAAAGSATVSSPRAPHVPPADVCACSALTDVVVVRQDLVAEGVLLDEAAPSEAFGGRRRLQRPTSAPLRQWALQPLHVGSAGRARELSACCMSIVVACCAQHRRGGRCPRACQCPPAASRAPWSVEGLRTPSTCMYQNIHI